MWILTAQTLSIPTAKMWMCHGHCGKQNKPEAVLAAAWKLWQCFGLQEFQLGMVRSCWLQSLAELGWFSVHCGFSGVGEVWGWEQLLGWTCCLPCPSAWQFHHREHLVKWPLEVCLSSPCLTICTSVTLLECNLGICSCTIKRVFVAAVTSRVWGLCRILVCVLAEQVI